MLISHLQCISFNGYDAVTSKNWEGNIKNDDCDNHPQFEKLVAYGRSATKFRTYVQQWSQHRINNNIAKQWQKLVVAIRL